MRLVYFFLPAAALALVACCEVMSDCFFWLEASFFDCFCEAFFCVDLGDLSPMILCSFGGLPHLRNVCFPESVHPCMTDRTAMARLIQPYLLRRYGITPAAGPS